MSEQSTEIDKLAGALAKAQGKITGAVKDSSNPFFKSRYADLAACWDACRSQLSENGLSVIQMTDVDDQGVVVVTTLAHESGQWVRGRLRMMPKDSSPQGIGSAITYARRYALAAMVGLAQIDDDGNAASGRQDDPRPEGWKAADTRKATADAKRLIEAATEAPHTIKSIWEELKTDEVYASAVWQKLPNPVKDAIKNEVRAA